MLYRLLPLLLLPAALHATDIPVSGQVVDAATGRPLADANITTFIAAIVLFGFGTGPIKGFAITLAIGIVSSMFTAIMGTRAVFNLIYGGRREDALSI